MNLARVKKRIGRKRGDSLNPFIRRARQNGPWKKGKEPILDRIPMTVMDKNGKTTTAWVPIKTKLYVREKLDGIELWKNNTF